jgi:CheY-like chemotaxis protein
MPGMSGIELLRRIRSMHPTAPPTVMMITAYNDEENYNQAKKYGADDFLNKPIDFSNLKQKLTESL